MKMIGAHTQSDLFPFRAAMRFLGLLAAPFATVLFLIASDRDFIDQD
jgi:hypothetical protein